MQQKQSLQLILLHSAAWLLFIGLMLFTSWVYNPGFRFDVAHTLLIYAQAALIFYTSNYLFFRFLPRRQFRQLAVSEGLFFLATFVGMSICSYVVQPLLYGEALAWPGSQNIWWFLISTVFWLFMLLSVLSLGYYFARRTLVQQQALRLAERSKLQAEQGKLEAEHLFLRAQINPHFLYNTLNFFYAKSLGGAPELSEGILILNDIMRYSLESGEDENGLVLLRNEVEHLENVIRIHQLRFSNRLQVQLTIDGEMNGLRIVPLVLITLVENAFKHGDLHNEAHPVRFQLHIQPGPQRRITFTSYNKKRNGPVEKYSGIGLVNIRKRLQWAYGERHRLQIQNEADHYSVTLQIEA